MSDPIPMPQPADDPLKKGREFLDPHWSKYEPLIEAAEKYAATTNTPAWRHQYGENQRRHREALRRASRTIVVNGESLITMGAHEDTEKAIKEAVKEVQSEREGYSAWRNRAVQSIAAMAEQSKAMREQAYRLAKEQENSSPLVSGTLAYQVAEVLKDWPTVAWDEETGVLSIVYNTPAPPAPNASA